MTRLGKTLSHYYQGASSVLSVITALYRGILLNIYYVGNENYEKLWSRFLIGICLGKKRL